MIFLLCKWYFDINWHKFEKRWANVFQIYPNAIHLNPLQFCPSMPLLGFLVFCLSSSIVLNSYFHILVNSMTIWSVLKLPKIAWPGPFNKLSWLCITYSNFQLYNFGETVSIVLWTDNWKPDSFYDRIASNRKLGLHTLCLLGKWSQKMHLQI